MRTIVLVVKMRWSVISFLPGRKKTMVLAITLQHAIFNVLTGCARIKWRRSLGSAERPRKVFWILRISRECVVKLVKLPGCRMWVNGVIMPAKRMVRLAPCKIAHVLTGGIRVQIARRGSRVSAGHAELLLLDGSSVWCVKLIWFWF